MTTRQRFRAGFCGAALFSMGAALAGCVVETRQGDTAIFTFAAWVPWVALLLGVAAFVPGWLLRRKSKLWGAGLMTAGLAVALLVAPGFFLDRSTVSSSGFTLPTGFWFAPTVFDIAFADLSRIELLAEQETDARGVTSTSRYLVCYRKAGGSEKVPFGDLMNAGTTARILEKARERGITVVDKL